jgi:transcriptional accessory protein Tex/SPT6
MVKVKILNSFVDKYTDEVYKVGDTVDFSVERLEELKQNLSVHDREFFEEVKNTKSKSKKDEEESPEEEIVEDTEE